MITGFVYVVTSAMLNVLNRKMKSVHFSIIQFDYAVFAGSTMFIVMLAEYLVLRDNKDRYPYPTLRILTYNLE